MDRVFQEEERRIDLASIRKIDCNISNILDKTDNVAFYRFDGKAWHKEDIHGSIFVFSRSVAPFYGFTILNRKSLSDNVIELLVDGLEFQRCDLYLLYKTSMSGVGDTGIKSIWFEDDAGCIRISALLNRLMRMRNESPGSERSGNIIQMFERSKERVRQSTSPDNNNSAVNNATCHSPTSSPPYRHNNKRNNRGSHEQQQYDNRRSHNNNYRNSNSEHDYRTNSYKHDTRPDNRPDTRTDTRHHDAGDGDSGRSHGNFHGVHKSQHVKHQNEKDSSVERCHSEDIIDDGTSKKNLFNMFSQAHKRFNTKSEVAGRKSPVAPAVPGKGVTIMKRCNSEIPNGGNKDPSQPIVNGLCVKSRSSEDVIKAGNTVIGGEQKTDVKTIPITFEDLVNSVKPKEVRTEKREERPLSCYSIEGSSSGPDENPGTSRISSASSSPHSPSSSLSDPLHAGAAPSITSQLPPLPSSLPSPSSSKPSSIATVKTRLSSINISDSAKLLMSPLDFKKAAPQPGITPSKVNPAKRILFEKRAKEPAASPCLETLDLSKFKELLVAAIQEDDDFAASLYSSLQKRITTAAR